MSSFEKICTACNKAIQYQSVHSTIVVCRHCGELNTISGLSMSASSAIPEMMSSIALGTTFKWSDKEFQVIGRILIFGENGYVMLWIGLNGAENIFLYESNHDYAIIDSIDRGAVPQSFQGKDLGEVYKLGGKKYFVEGLDKVHEVYVEGEIPDFGLKPENGFYMRLTGMKEELMLAFILDKSHAFILNGDYTAVEELSLTNTRIADEWKS